MPGVDRDCTTHHYACECREEAMKDLDMLYRRIIHAMDSEPSYKARELYGHLAKFRERLGYGKGLLRRCDSPACNCGSFHEVKE